jgi:ABC-type uncharacterized transport system permease subunit
MLNSLWDQIVNLSIFAVLLRSLPAILFGALGGLLSDRAGVMNIGIEGQMLISAFTAIAAGSATGSWLVGIIAAIAVSMLVSLGIAFFSLNLKVDVVVAGFAVNIFGAAITVLMLNVLYGVQGQFMPKHPVRIPKLDIPIIADIPVLGKLLSGHNWMVWLSLLAVWFCHYLLNRTPYGFHLRATGEEHEAARSLGIKVERIQYSALLWCGFFTALAGSYLSMGATGLFVRDMTAGTGFLALAVVIFGNKHPIGALLGSLLFALAQTLVNIVETTPGNAVPSQLIKMFPYIVTIIVLVIYAIRKNRGSLRRTIASS